MSTIIYPLPTTTERVCRHNKMSGWLRSAARAVGGRLGFGGPSLPLYDVPAEVRAACSDSREYFNTIDDLVYLHSPDVLPERANICVTLGEELMLALRSAKGDPLAALAVIDTMSNLMCLTADPAEATRMTHPHEAYRSSANEAYQRVHATMAELNTRRELYDAIVALTEADTWAVLTEEQRTATAVMKRDMDSHGIHLPADDRAVIARASAEQEALAHALILARGGQEQAAAAERLVEARHRFARLSGCASYAELQLPQALARTPAAASRFLNALSQSLQEKAAAEHAVVQAAMRSVGSATAAGCGGLERAHAARKAHLMLTYGAKLQKLSEYLSVANVWRGLQLVCKRLFGLELRRNTEMHDFERYDAALHRYDVYDRDGALLGVIYADMLDRPSKNGSAASYTVQLGARLHRDAMRAGGANAPRDRQLPITIFSCNARGGRGRRRGSGDGAEEDEWESVLLSTEETVSLFHEFGHALHTVLGQTGYQIVSGTRSSTDYVETFSQLFEHFARDPRALREYAFHYKTGEPVPEDLLDAQTAASEVFSATEQLSQVVLASLDLALHGTRPLLFVGLGGDQRNCRRLDLAYPLIHNEHFPFAKVAVQPLATFSANHLAGYPAAYYSYAYSRVCYFFLFYFCSFSLSLSLSLSYFFFVIDNATPKRRSSRSLSGRSTSRTMCSPAKEERRCGTSWASAPRCRRRRCLAASSRTVRIRRSFCGRWALLDAPCETS